MLFFLSSRRCFQLKLHRNKGKCFTLIYLGKMFKKDQKMRSSFCFQLFIYFYYLYYVNQQTSKTSIYINMGTSHVRDPNIELFVESNKQYYVAGEYVEGCAYLNVKVNSNYSNITLYVLGNQYVYWTQGSEEHKTTYSHQYESYRSFFLLNDFKGNVQQGQYSFPFAFRLPNMMCGSFFLNQSCYIKYVVRVQLVHPTEPKNTQFFDMPLNIVEPPRSPLGQVMSNKTTHAICCGCCDDYGVTTVILNGDKNFMMTSDSYSVKGTVDHSQGKQDIKIARVMLQQRLTKVSSSGVSRTHTVKSWAVHGINQPIKKGQIRSFQFNQTIPTDITQSTAIGRVAAIYYVLKFQSEYGCCAMTATADLHLVIISRTPSITKKMDFPKPEVWNPITFNALICEEMKPYILNPMPQIPYHNMPGPVFQQNPNNQMMNEYSNNNNGYHNYNETSINELNQQQNQNQKQKHQKQLNQVYFPNIDQYANHQPVYNNHNPYQNDPIVRK